MKKIITVTFQNAYNYGATLQCYALQKALCDKGYDVTVLNYDNPKIGNMYKPIFFSDIKKSKKRFILSIVKSLIHFKPRYKRAKNFVNFIDNNISLSKKVKASEIENNCIQADCYITGSDQVWNTDITKGFDNIYTLNFNCNAKKISYAASVGESSCISKYNKMYKKIMDNLDYISVRENDAKVELDKITQKDIKVTLDPTLLLEKEKWDYFLDKNGKDDNEEYICAYVVSQDKEHLKIVNELSAKRGLKVIHFGIKNPGYNNTLETRYAQGPIDFINTIKNAEYVITTSFHATVFSIIFNKKFWVIPHKKTGERVRDLLKKLGIEDRAVDSLEEFKTKDFNAEIDWKSVNKKLEIERQKSEEWLLNALEE